MIAASGLRRIPNFDSMAGKLIVLPACADSNHVMVVIAGY